MRTRQTLAALLAALMLVPSLVACGSDEDTGKDTPTTTTAGGENTAEDTTTVETELTLAFDKENNNDKAFHIMTVQEADYEYLGDSTGDRVSSAVYDRNLAVEEYLGIKLDIRYESGSWKNRNTYNTMVKQSVEADDGSIDYATGMISCIVPIVSTQYFANLLEISSLDLDNPWWVSSMQTEAAINGKLLTLMGDVCLSMYKGLTVVLFNKDLVDADSALEDPYTLVNRNEWTYEKFIEQTSGHGSDVNGDGVYEFGTDVYNMMGEGNAWRSWNAALQIHSLKMEDGEPTLIDPDDKLTTAASKFQTYWASNKDIILADSDDNIRATAFSANQAIYAVTKLELVEKLADMESDFGIVPMPKYDSDQDGYYTPIAGASEIIVVPQTASDLNLVGKVLEAMSFYSRKIVVPAYYDSALKERYSRDPETAGMLDLVREGAYNGVDYLYASTLSATNTVWVNYTVSPDTMIKKNETYNVVSSFESNTGTWRKKIDEVILPAYSDPDE